MNDTVLEHFGVLGMRWGHRKSPEDQMREKDHAWEKNAVSTKTYFKVYNAAADRMNSGEIYKINNKPQYKNKNLFEDKVLLKRYEADYNKVFNKVLAEECGRFIGTNPSGTRKITAKVDVLGEWPKLYLDDIKHSLEDSMGVLVERNSNGLILRIILQDVSKIIPSTFNSSYLPQFAPEGEIMEDTQLKHFGVLGMKWGRRNNKQPAYSGPTSADHDRAVNNKSSWKASREGYAHSKRRLYNEGVAQRVIDKNKDANRSKDPRAMTDKELKSFLNDPIMKRTVKDIREQDDNKRRLGANIVGAVLIGGFYVHALGIDKFVVKTAKKAATDFVNGRRYVTPKPGVIDAHFK